MEKPVRVRFAPSPTGPLHIGGVRTALYNYLFAKKHGGVNILRIEDTDQTRFVPGAEQYIIESFRWLGIEFDEGVHTGGPHAPYRQSERKPMYRQYAEQLVNSGHAYYAFDTPEALEAEREKMKASGSKDTWNYSAATRGSMSNSLTLTAGEVQKKLENGEAYVVRIKIPEGEEVKLHDLIRGEVTVSTDHLDDKVLFKSDGMPTYHLANVVDDYLMQISHVIRGEEWLPSAPLHVLLYRFLGWEKQMPQFAHLPLLLKPDGNGKLSKRDGDRLGFPVFPLEWKDPFTGEISSGYRESGWIPEAVVNLVALLGWHPADEKELFTVEELVRDFSLDRVNKAGAKFDLDKARWFNQHYLREKTDRELALFVLPDLKAAGFETDEETLEKVIAALKQRIIFAKDIITEGSYFFRSPEEFDPELVRKKVKPAALPVIAELIAMFEQAVAFDAASLEEKTKSRLQELNSPLGEVMPVLRIMLTGGMIGVAVFDIASILGKEETLRRLQNGMEKISQLIAS